jgi:hypothetical protein
MEVEFGGEVFKSKPSPSTNEVNTYSEFAMGKVTVTLHHTKATDVEFLRRFREGEVVLECRETGKQWQSTMSISESCKLQDNGRGMPLVLEGGAFIQTKG